MAQALNLHKTEIKRLSNTCTLLPVLNKKGSESDDRNNLNITGNFRVQIVPI